MPVNPRSQYMEVKKNFILMLCMAVFQIKLSFYDIKINIVTLLPAKMINIFP